MANLNAETLNATVPITCPADKLFNFFKYSLHEIVKIFPAAFKDAQILEGQQGTVGCVLLFSYIIGGIGVSAKVKIGAIDDAARSVTYVVLEGDVLQLYKSFSATITVSDGEAKWVIAFEKATLLTPPPVLYVPLAITVCTLVDAYLLVN